ncbi:unnamed protein product [Rotaria socialis]
MSQRYLMQRHEFWTALLPDEPSSDSDSNSFNYANTDKLDLESKLFYLINTEVQLSQILKPNTPFTVVTGDPEWFGSSVPHEIIRVFLKLCDMPEKSKKKGRLTKLAEYIHDDLELITFDEYKQRRETHHLHWSDVYMDMLSITSSSLPTSNHDIGQDITIFTDAFTSKSCYKKIRYNKDNDNYLRWLLFYCGEQIQSTFNQLDFIDSDNIPIDLITLMKTTKIDREQEPNDDDDE